MPEFLITYNADEPATYQRAIAPKASEVVVKAVYYRREDPDWCTFKDADHKVVFDVRSDRVASIKRMDKGTER